MRVALVCLLAATAATVFSYPSFAQSEQVLYSFDSQKTGFPDGNLLRERSGTLIGAATGYGNAAGQIFSLKRSGASWRLTKLLGFDGKNGAAPQGGLTAAPGGLYYGTTAKGGDYGRGTVFQLVHSGGRWLETVLQSFQNGASNYPQGKLAAYKGALYGTTWGGKGAVFELRSDGKSWNQSMLHVFDGSDGRKPVSGLIRDPATGVFYGTTLSGGSSGCGTVFALTASSFTTIHDFGCGRDGAQPESGLTEDASGALYGTTSAGGDTGCGYKGSGCGTVFRLEQAQSGWRYKIIHTFTGSDGIYPQNHDGLAVDAAGSIYGTTSQGGTYNRGVVFKVAASGNGFTILHSFGCPGDGEYPAGGIIEDERSGTLYGTTFSGGAYGYGTVYRITQ